MDLISDFGMRNAERTDSEFLYSAIRNPKSEIKCSEIRNPQSEIKNGGAA